MTTKTSITDDLRAQLSTLDGHRSELLSERDELSYLALIDKEPKAIKRLAAINEEIRNLTVQAETIEPALKEAVRRESVAQEEFAAEARRQKAREAEMLCVEAESIAEGLDAAFAMITERARAYDTAMTGIRRLIGVGPQSDLIRIFLGRALRTSTMRTPLHMETIAPGERTSVSAATASWLSNIRIHTGRTLAEKTAAKKAA